MAEESVTTSTVTEPTPLANDPTTRAPDGTILDQGKSLTPDPALVTTTSTEAPSSDPPKPTAPEKYEFTAPTGQTLDEAFLAEATPIFKELGLDQAGAQKLVDTYNKLAGGKADLAVEAVNRMRGEWRGEVETRLEAKGDALKAKLAPIGVMKNVLFANDTKGRLAFEAAMNLTGAGDHPDIVASMLKIAERYNEGTHVTGGGPSAHGQRETPQAKPSPAQAMYPNLKSSAA